MNFNSLSFAIFLPIVFFIYWLFPARKRWVVLFLASYYFYMSWNVKYVVLILLTTIASYCGAILIEKFPTKKKLYLGVIVFIDVGILVLFKYFNFFLENIVKLAKVISIDMSPVYLKLLLPVGISFYTFQTMSYVIDIYRGNGKAEHHFGKYATFISFFPQLVAGPIERVNDLLPQIKEVRQFNRSKAEYGIGLMAWGFFKKMVVADTLAIYVNAIYNDLYNNSGLSLIVATVFFSIQIYCDFSGYSDIALGTAKLFDIDLSTNFRSPYFSASIKEFWSRWHISLSTWLRDYIYIPLGGSRVSKWKYYRNLLITFLISGLWHGANSTYLLWGGIHAIGQIIERMLNLKRGCRKYILCLRVFGVYVFCCIAWIFFRVQNVSDAFYIISNSLKGIGNPLNYIWQGYLDLGMSKQNIIPCILMIIILLLYDYKSLKEDMIKRILSMPLLFRWLFMFLLIWFIILFTPTRSNNEFIYFQF